MNKKLVYDKDFSTTIKLLTLSFFFTFFSYHVVAQQKVVVTGVVKTQDNIPLPGVSVSAQRATTAGTITDNQGHFSIETFPDDMLVFEFVGYQKQEVALGKQSWLDVTLSRLETELDEVVVIGYGTKVKGELTGAVSKVNSKIFETRPLTNTMNALQGAMPGVTVTRGSGRPGGENYNLQIRGASSMSGGKVLVLIDGIPGDLNLINPNDIAELTVLKDAAASIYGARAADGVVIVTTKKGKKGVPTVQYAGNYGIKKPHYLKKRTNTLQLAEMYDEGMRNINQPGVSEDVFNKIRSNAEPDPNGWLIFLENFPGFYQSHNWIDAVFGNGSQHMHNVNVSGGSDNNNYLFSVGYAQNNGVFKHGENRSDRYNLRLNYDFKVSKRLSFETRTSFESQPIIEPTALGSILYFVNQMGSYVPIYNPSGQLYKYQGGFRNPIQYLKEAGVVRSNTYRFSTNVKGNLQILPDLKLVGQVGVNLDFADGKRTNPTFAQHNWDGSNFDIVNVPNNAVFTNSKNIYQNYTGYLDYSKTINRHRINAMAGSSREGSNYQGQSITGYNFASNEIFSLNLADRTKTQYANFTGNASDWALQSYFGRLSYTFDKKYLLDFTTRMDGSSKFAKDKRWSALFPSVALAWNLSEENFVNRLNMFDNLKLRASWGKSGNQELSFGNYDYISLINITGSYPMGVPNVGLPGAISNIASVTRTWETIETRNIGVDFSILKSRLSGTLDYYVKRNNNMLVNDQLPATLGGSAPTQNIGRLETKGWDVSLAWTDRIGEFTYSISGIISDAKNKLLEIKGNNSYGEGLIYAREGYSLNSYFGYYYDGIIKDARQLESYKQLGNVPANVSIGDVMYRDIDGDGRITAFGDPASGTTGDMVYLGNLLPRYIYSSNINLSYKGLDLGIFLQGVGKRQGIRTGEFSYPFPAVWMQPLEYFYGKSWTPENPDAQFPRIIPGFVGYDDVRNWNWRYSSMRMNNLAYLRIKVLTVGYNFPQTIVNRAKLHNVRVYVSGQDLFTFSKGTWNGSFDPEETWERSDEQTYPFNKVISFGLDIKF